MGQNKLKKDKITKSVAVSKNGTITDNYENIKLLLNDYFDLYVDSDLLLSENNKYYMLYEYQFGITKLSILVDAFKRSKYSFFITYDVVKSLYVANIFII